MHGTPSYRFMVPPRSDHGNPTPQQIFFATFLASLSVIGEKYLLAVFPGKEKLQLSFRRMVSPPLRVTKVFELFVFILFLFNKLNRIKWLKKLLT